jgi:hypothetical protein
MLIDSHFSAFESYSRTSTFQHLNHAPILIVLPIDTTKVQKILTCNHRYVLDFHLLGGGIIQSRTEKGFDYIIQPFLFLLRSSFGSGMEL